MNGTDPIRFASPHWLEALSPAPIVQGPAPLVVPFAPAPRAEPKTTIDRVTRNRAWLDDAQRALTYRRSEGRLVVARTPVPAHQRRDDVARTIAELAEHPQLSAHEVWLQGAGARRRCESGYFAELRATELAAHLDRPIDRLGDEPNLLLAAHFASFLFGLPEGTSYASAVAEFKETFGPRGLTAFGWKDFSTHDADLLREIYPFIPEWSLGKKGPYDLRIDDLPRDLRVRLAALSQIPLATPLMESYADIRGERGALAGTLLVTTEHALADKVDLFRHLTMVSGLAGRDIRVAWKPHSADPVVMDLCERMFGIQSHRVSLDAEGLPHKNLQWAAEGLLEQAVIDVNRCWAGGEPRTVNVHLQGVRSWGVVGELRERYPNVPINACSHTTSEVPEIDRMPPGLEQVALTVMATSEAKRRYERFVFTPTLIGLFPEIEKLLESEVDVLRTGRRFLVYGGAGKIIGGAVVDGLLALGQSIAVVDPLLSTPEGRLQRESLMARGVDIIDEATLGNELAKEGLFVINATDNDAFGHDDYVRLKHKTVLMNLGTGQTGFSLPHLERLAFDRSTAGAQRRQLVGDSERNQKSYVYKILNGEGAPVDVVALGDTAVYNLGDRAPNPRSLSAFNNLLIVESLHQAVHDRERGRLGPRVLGSVQVSFTAGSDPGPVIAFLGRDLPNHLPWPKVWTEPTTARGPVTCVDLTQRPDEARRISATCAT